MIRLSELPLLNATLNAVSFVLLMAGYACIRRGRVRAHKRFMVSAFCVSVLFLISYLTYRFLGTEKKFGGPTWIRPVYYFVLITHVTLAASVPFLATRTLYLALRGRFDKHRRIAKVTFPIWVYVSITGVLVYLLLFRMYGPLPSPDPWGDRQSTKGAARWLEGPSRGIGDYGIDYRTQAQPS